MPVQAIDVKVTSDDAVVPSVRHLARQVGVVLGCEVDVELLALLTTELLTNAVRQAAGDVVAAFSRSGPGRVRVSVWDAAAARPHLENPDPLEDGGHRGLLVVDRLAEAWGVEERRVGKVVWFEVRCHAPHRDAPVRTRPAAEHLMN